MKISYKQVLMAHKKFLEDEIALEMNWLLKSTEFDDRSNLNHMHKVGIYQKILIKLLNELLK